MTITIRHVDVGEQQEPVPSSPVEPWTFVGRDQELEAVVDALAGSEPGTVVISGPPGVGKTRLAQEAVAVARRRGQPTEWATGTRASSSIPLGALAHFVSAPPTSSPSAATLHHAVAALASSGGEPGLVVGIDDAHLLDELSAALVHKIVLTRTASVVLTVRSCAAAPDLVAALWRDNLASRIELAPLSGSQVEQLLSTALGGIVESRTCAEMSTMSGGSAATLRELVHAGHETGRLRAANGVWRWEGDVAPTPRLIEVVGAELGELGRGEESALELLAVGGSLGLAELVEMTSSDAVAALERRGLVTAEQVSRHTEARLAQPLHAEVLRAKMPRAVSRQLRGSLGRRTSSTEDPVRAGVLLLDSDGPSADPGVLAAAAAHANARRDYGLAERLARAAVDDGAGCAAQVALVEAVRCQGRPDEAEAQALAAVAFAESEDERTDLAVTCALNLFHGLGRTADAVAELEKLAGSATGGSAQATATAVQAMLSFLAGRAQESVDLAEAVLADVRNDARAEVWASAALTAGTAVLGRTDAALAAAASGWVAADRCSAETEISSARLALAQSELLALGLAGRLRRAEQRAAELHRSILARAGSAGDGVTALGLGSAALAAGSVATAVRWLTEAEARLVDADPIGCMPRCRAQLARAHAVLGDRAAVARVLTVSATAGRSAVRVFEPENMLADAWQSAVEHRTEEAADRAVQAASVAARTGQPAVEAEALHAAVRLGRAADATDRLHQLAGLVDGALVPTFAAHAGAVTRGMGERLDEVAAEFEAAGAVVLSVDAAAHAAQAHERAGQRRQARASATRAASLARGCGGVRTPALAELVPPSLTSREQEVATMAAKGAHNPEIARQLVLSVRTVESHLARAYTKLGIGSRAELGAALVGVTER